jgi:hypothetical protein
VDHVAVELVDRRFSRSVIGDHQTSDALRCRADERDVAIATGRLEAVFRAVLSVFFDIAFLNRAT